MRLRESVVAGVVAVAALSGCDVQGGGNGEVTRLGGTPTASGSATSGQSATAPPTTPAMTVTPVWHLVDVPALRPPTSVLHDVVAIDATHAFAVGSENYSPQQPDTSGVPVMLQWGGQRWSQQPLPGITWHGGLSKVAGDAVGDVWAVGGSTGPGPENTVTHVLRYDGSRWTEVPFPRGNHQSLHGITGLAVAGGHAWLVGYAAGGVPLIQEWDGHAWQEGRPPADCLRVGTSYGGMPTFCNITSVTAFAPDDVWAAGNGAWQGFRGPLVFHWDGRSWQTVQVGINRQDYSFSAIGGTSGTDLWAAAGPRGGTLVMHFDGQSWQTVGGLSATGLVELRKLITDTAGRPWLIEDFDRPSAALATYSPADGWTATEAPRPDGTVGDTVTGITAVPGTSLMLAVGGADLPTTPRTLKAIIIEYSNPATPAASASPTISPAASPTPAGSTTPGS